MSKKKKFLTVSVLGIHGKDCKFSKGQIFNINSGDNDEWWQTRDLAFI